MKIDENRIAQILSALLRERRPEARRAGCPEEEKLANYLGTGLSRRERTEVEGHFAGCSDCLDAVVAAYEATREGDVSAVPGWLIDRARVLVRPAAEREGVFELVLRLARGALELVSTSGRLVPMLAPAPVRRGSAPSESRVVQVEKEMGRFKLGVEVEQLEEGLCQAVLGVTDENGKPADGIRLSLISAGREQSSFLTRRGLVVFERIPPGDYTVSVSDSGAVVGTIKLRVEPE